MASHLTRAYNGDADLVLVLDMRADAPVLLAMLMEQLIGKAHHQRTQIEESQHTEGMPEIDIDVSDISGMGQKIGQKVSQAARAQIRNDQIFEMRLRFSIRKQVGVCLQRRN